MLAFWLEVRLPLLQEEEVHLPEEGHIPMRRVTLVAGALVVTPLAQELVVLGAIQVVEEQGLLEIAQLPQGRAEAAAAAQPLPFRLGQRLCSPAAPAVEA